MMECDQTETTTNTTASTSSFSSASEYMSFSVNPTSAFGVVEDTYRKHHHQYPNQVSQSISRYFNMTFIYLAFKLIVISTFLELLQLVGSSLFNVI